MNIFIDTETFNTKEHDIKKVGTVKYAQTCELMLTTVAIDNEPVFCIDHTQGDTLTIKDGIFEVHYDLCGIRTRYATDYDPQSTLFIAQNAIFDRHVLISNGVMQPGCEWRDNQAKCLSMGLPSALEMQGIALGLEDDLAKIKDGKRLINKFCKPAGKNHKVERYTAENSPDDWKKFKEYAIRDVIAMREIWNQVPEWNYR